MDYRQFMKIMDQSQESEKESISSLQEFIKEFPYFQSAHALLAKSMLEQQHVRYEKQLKIAAAYAGDRKSLFDLIHKNNSNLIHEKTAPHDSPFISPLIPEINESENTVTQNIKAVASTDLEEEISIEFPFGNQVSESPKFIVSLGENKNDEIELIADDEIPAEDPHDIIRRRLIEILGLNEEKKSEVIQEKPLLDIKIESTPASVDQKSKNTPAEIKIKTTTEIPTDDFVQLFEESDKAVDIIQKEEIEYALESTLIHSLEKLPIIEKTKQKDELSYIIEEKEGYSFYDWLKIKTTKGYGKIEEVHAYSTELLKPENAIKPINILIESDQFNELSDEKKSENINQLIDRFIYSSPKIIPSKVEFYSPSNQAKKSITENEDVVSETLAKIYQQQGNLLKARSSYQKLSLLIPEKIAYFAALISELDKEINKQDKQDL